MQRLTALRAETTRLCRVISSSQTRCLSNISSNDNKKNDLGVNPSLYKPSTAKTETSVPEELHSGQPRQTYEAPPKSTPTLTGGGKVWSVQNSGSVHIAPLGAAKTTFVPTSTGHGTAVHETTVLSTHGPAGSVNPSTTNSSQTEPTPGQLAEAAAASAFETFPPDEPLTTLPPTEAVFAPKVSSTDIHSATISPTDRFGTASPTSTAEKPSLSSSTSSSSSSSSSFKKDSSSTTQEIPIQRETDIRDEILREGLKYVDEKGWTLDAIRAGLRASNQPSTVEGLFSNGYDLVEYFIRDANEKMVNYMKEKSQKGDLQGSRLLVDGLKYRLSLVIPYANTWDQALAQGALPQNAMRGWKNLLDLSSDAWHAIGDTSTDLNWYSKRLLVAAVYKSAEIYMLQDQSLDKTDTMNFLERRLSDFQAFGSFRNTVSKSFSDTTQIVNGLFSVVRNLTSRR